jgi:phage-related minor tail protein
MAVTIGELNVNINVDITETIRGLKAIQREAKKAAQALRELEADMTITSGTISADEGGRLAVLNRDYVLTRKQADEFAKAVRELAVTVGSPDVKINASSPEDSQKIADKLAKAVNE